MSSEAALMSILRVVTSETLMRSSTHVIQGNPRRRHRTLLSLTVHEIRRGAKNEEYAISRLFRGYRADEASRRDKSRMQTLTL
jgi:hypothetical protein